MSHQVIDKRGQAKPSDKIVTLPQPGPIVAANADGSVQPQTDTPGALILTPFPDGTCLKMVKRALPDGHPSPAGFDQHLLLNVAGDQLAITKNETIAHLICDAVNMLFAAQVRHEQEQKELVNLISAAPTTDLQSTQS